MEVFQYLAEGVQTDSVVNKKLTNFGDYLGFTESKPNTNTVGFAGLYTHTSHYLIIDYLICNTNINQ